ncbi:MAG: transcription termination factor NusA [Caldilinea sp.]|nr:transcription termination/antitermination protein NusA [Caldilinea sp.]MCB9114794.1 transcription termination/antitermination protein NusA [Caldilineaceae bacterium]MCB9120344.1 transcription termination/antitermination protein NusA [Caldilineaceae bacterium]MCB9125912.1 transcription termination/antitermination protein NusA [Caldilineaceae bacterium]MCO5208614.1 transcription termination factor NusA [Caldilinea sp.]
MSKALIAGINQVATDKGLDREVIFQAIEAALVSAYKRNYGPIANVTAEVDRVSGEMRVLTEREVVDEVFNEHTEITEVDAKKLAPASQMGDVIRVPNTPNDFGRIAAQTAKQVILQRIREAERDTVYENFAHRVGEVITAQVRSVDTLSGAVSLLLDDKHECLMMREDQIPTEKLRRGDYLKVYVVDVHKSTRGPVIKISRTHRNLLRRLMEQEIPEVRDGKVEIKSIAREPGHRSKVAVLATVPGLDAVGSCVGLRGLRIQNIVNELSGEKIDVVEWNETVGSYISNALSPAKVQAVLLDDDGAIKTATVVVPDRQLSLAIGKEGQNARLAAKLTGWRIDIKSDSESREEGLDQVIADRAQAAAIKATEDLLAKAERILRSEDDGVEDRLLQAAQALRDGDPMAVEAPEILSGDFKSFEELLAEVADREEGPGIGDATFETEELQGAQQSAAPEWPDLPEEEPALPSEAAFSEEEVAVEPSPLADVSMTTQEELPEVITADMLRARMAERKKFNFADEDFEVPAELLAGYDEEELDEEDLMEEVGKGKTKGKAKTKAKGKAKPQKGKSSKRRWDGGDEEF